MNLLFLNPPFKGRFSRASRSPAVTKGGTFYFPIWLAYAAGVAEQAGHCIRLYDAPAEGRSLSNIFTLMGGFKPDILIMETSTPSIYNDAEIAEKFKDKYKDVFIVLTGTHPSALPVETINLNACVDAVTVGEYDFTIRDLAKAIELQQPLDRVKGLVFRKGEQVVKNDYRDKIEDLDEIPFVSSVYKKYLDYRNYFFAAANYPMIMIMTGRGCPHRCFFCVYPQVFHGRRYRVRSPENVVDEIEYIIKNFPKVKEVGIEDDCFSANRSHAKRICELIIERKTRIKWYCNVRGDLDYKLLRLMKQAGCRLVTVGFESSSQKVLDNMNKDEKVERYYQFAKDARKAGILVHGCIMVGNPGDDRETLKKSYEFSKKINCDSMQFYPLYVYPGTDAYTWAKERGYLKTTDFSQWLTNEGFHNCVLETPDLSPEEMVVLCDDYLKKYHLRPRYILGKMWQAVRDPWEGHRTFKSAKVFFAKIIAGSLGRGNSL